MKFSFIYGNFFAKINKIRKTVKVLCSKAVFTMSFFACSSSLVNCCH